MMHSKQALIFVGLLAAASLAARAQTPAASPAPADAAPASAATPAPVATPPPPPPAAPASEPAGAPAGHDALPPHGTQKAMQQLGADCKSCHTCDAPTVENPCLLACTRQSAVSISEEFRRKHGPTVVILDELEDRYLPVPFDHQGHAEMAKMTRGCQVCHHYTPEGLAHPACRSCHELNPVREDMQKPSLKGAYHRQCMSCHREWSGNTECGACHHPKTGVARSADVSMVPSKDDLIGRMHPPIPEPDTKIYKTRIEGKPPTEVLFRHKEHIKRYGLICAECHQEDNCSRCHQEGAAQQQRPRTLADHHRPCSQCHANVNPVDGVARCEACHYDRRSGPPRPFEHTITDLPLMKYHRSNSCRECHVTVPFGKLSPECGSCHDSWTQANFKHEITGQILDEQHRELDCTECHADRNYTAAPACNACHDSTGDDAVNFPAKRPGPVVQR